MLAVFPGKAKRGVRWRVRRGYVATDLASPSLEVRSLRDQARGDRITSESRGP